MPCRPKVDNADAVSLGRRRHSGPLVKPCNSFKSGDAGFFAIFRPLPNVRQVARRSDANGFVKGAAFFQFVDVALQNTTSKRWGLPDTKVAGKLYLWMGSVSSATPSALGHAHRICNRFCYAVRMISPNRFPVPRINPELVP